MNRLPGIALPLALVTVSLALPACGPDAPETTGGGSPAETAAVDAADAVSRGRDKSVTCVACHGALGDSDNELWPNLAGQTEVYFAEQLKKFRSGQRQNPWMSPMAEPLSDRDIDDLAAYYASLEGLSGGPDNPGPPAQSCVACHGSSALRANPAWPALGGQNAPYLAAQLRAYRAGEREAPVMAPLARPLTDQQIDELAALYARH